MKVTSSAARLKRVWPLHMENKRAIYAMFCQFLTGAPKNFFKLNPFHPKGARRAKTSAKTNFRAAKQKCWKVQKIKRSQVHQVGKRRKRTFVKSELEWSFSYISEKAWRKAHVRAETRIYKLAQEMQQWQWYGSRQTGWMDDTRFRMQASWGRQTQTTRVVHTSCTATSETEMEKALCKTAFPSFTRDPKDHQETFSIFCTIH